LLKVTPQVVDSLYDFAKFQFECGNYTGAAEFLFHFRALNTNPEKDFNALWGKFAAEILMRNWDDAFKDMNYIVKELDENRVSHFHLCIVLFIFFS
jgi:translation initiation factor 3 subunit E